MHQYISRRRRCWKLLEELDPELVLSEGHRADLLLDLAGLDKHERTMIQASIGNARDFDKIAEALVLQHPRVHLKHTAGDKRKGYGKRAGKVKGKFTKGKGGKGKFLSFRKPWRNPVGFAHMAVDNDWDPAAFLGDNPPGPLADDSDEEPWTDPAHWSEDGEYDESAYVGDGYSFEEEQQWEQYTAYIMDEWIKRQSSPETVEDPLEAAELECVACLADALGPECFEDACTCSDFIQAGAVAFLASRQKGNPKGSWTGSGRYPVRPSNLTIEDRRKKLAELKAKTECKDCGKRGHWRGDKECPLRKGKTVHLAFRSSCSSSDPQPGAGFLCR